MSKFNLAKSKENFRNTLLKKDQSLSDLKAQVIAVLDISGSMQNYYKAITNNKIQEVLNYLSAVAFSLDDNGELDTYLFSHKSDKLPTNVTESNMENYVREEILNGDDPNHIYWGSTRYAPFMRLVLDDFFEQDVTKTETSSGGFFGLFAKKTVTVESSYQLNSKDNYPVYVIILTDGMCDDTSDTIDMINKTKDSNIYWQFIGVTNNPRELDKIRQWGDTYQNVGFFSYNDLSEMDENSLYTNLVNSEFVNFVNRSKQF